MPSQTLYIIPLPTSMSQAVLDSIAHWERHATGQRFEDEMIDGRWCSLCVYTKAHDPDCTNCAFETELGTDCGAYGWLEAREAWTNYGPDSHEFRTAARHIHSQLLHIANSMGLEVTQ